jgi:hypothetical protein
MALHGAAWRTASGAEAKLRKAPCPSTRCTRPSDEQPKLLEETLDEHEAGSCPGSAIGVASKKGLVAQRSSACAARAPPRDAIFVRTGVLTEVLYWERYWLR